LPAPRLDVLIGHDDKEVDRRDEDDEVDDRGNELADVYERLEIAGPDFHPRADFAGTEAGDDRVDDIGREGGDEHAERESHDQSDRDDDYVTRIRKFLKPLIYLLRFANSDRTGRGA
jgi:hypothetical protein